MESIRRPDLRLLQPASQDTIFAVLNALQTKTAHIPTDSGKTPKEITERKWSTVWNGERLIFDSKLIPAPLIKNNMIASLSRYPAANRDARSNYYFYSEEEDPLARFGGRTVSLESFSPRPSNLDHRLGHTEIVELITRGQEKDMGFALVSEGECLGLLQQIRGSRDRRKRTRKRGFLSSPH